MWGEKGIKLSLMKDLPLSTTKGSFIDPKANSFRVRQNLGLLNRYVIQRKYFVNLILVQLIGKILLLQMSTVTMPLTPEGSGFQLAILFLLPKGQVTVRRIKRTD